MSNTRMPAWLEQIPPVTRNLLIINVLIWLVEFCSGRFGETLINTLGLHFWGADKFNPVQILTYMFLHDNHTILHIAFNMFTLWMFGRILERVWGSRRFIVFYFVCGIGAALVQECVWQMTWHQEYIDGIAALNGLTPEAMADAVARNQSYFQSGLEGMKNALVTVGASGAIFGLLLGFAFVFPDMPMYLFFIPVPIKAKYMVIGYGIMEFFLGVSGRQASVAHFAHLGGLIFGLILLLYWRHKGTLRGNNFFY
ncbi:MAG: rhomboid family intramembrane serine protease [Bacteroides sp.]|nr:rhomboid family intramembrane serine protease [Bacteroides sp.]MDE6235663.1 rhomboid family intramembrane serine protease [Muribaculaceae bacterium]